MHSFGIESYGVKIRFVSNRKRLLERVRTFANVVLLNDTREIDPAVADHEFRVTEMYGELSLHLNDENLSGDQNVKGFYHYFDSRLRILVAEYAVNRLFLHCGAIAWKGKGVLFPAESYHGKSAVSGHVPVVEPSSPAGGRLLFGRICGIGPKWPAVPICKDVIYTRPE